MKNSNKKTYKKLLIKINYQYPQETNFAVWQFYKKEGFHLPFCSIILTILLVRGKILRLLAAYARDPRFHFL